MKRVLHKSQFGRRIVSYAVAVITIFSVSQYSIYALTNGLNLNIMSCMFLRTELAPGTEL